MVFQALLLQAWYGLSDPSLEKNQFYYLYKHKPNYSIA